MIEIPLNSEPEQIFNTVIGGTLYDLRVLYSSRTGIWALDISQDGDELLSGVALLSGVDIFSQHTIPISNVYIVNTENNKFDPSSDNLGTVCKLIILTDEEIEDVSSV